MKINVKLILTRECYILCRLFQCHIGDVLVYYMAKKAKRSKGAKRLKES